jgi:tetratricopeptide (TPR) repeat protein
MTYQQFDMTNINNYTYIYINTISPLRIWITFSLILLSTFSFSQDQSEIQLANEYLLKGDKKKALELFRDLAKNDSNTPYVYNNYLNVMIDLAAYDEAQNYLKKLSKRDPGNMQYDLDMGYVMVKAGDLGKADHHFNKIISENKENSPRIKLMGDYFMSRSLMEYGIRAMNESRKVIGNDNLYCLELAMFYRIQGNQDKMVQEYLNYVTQNAANIQYVKNIMQALLTKPEELESLEKLLYDRVQQYPDVEVYADLLIWVTMQQKNFYASFIQARAYDKRYKHDGEKSMEVARVALDNEDYDNALKIYRYVVREYENTPNHLLARLGLIRTREARVKKTYPVKTDSVRILIADYDNFIKNYSDNINALEAARSEALLFANYLDEKDSAVSILTVLINNPRTSLYLKSKAKLDLGDIYLLKGEPWESTLLYSQVEKTQKENLVGYEAKLKNAKLSYYKGNFSLAQEHLDILKEATTREIANDALDLSLRIKENIAFDSAGAALHEYASIELLLYQNKYDEAMKKIESLKQGISSDGTTFSNQTMLDDVYWLEANLRMKRGEFEQAILLLGKILEEYQDDVLADDAYFLQAEIYERQLNNKEKAKELYREFLNKYPGSVFAAEARKRFRTLRGDFAGQEQPQF